MKTYSAKPHEIERAWFVVDASSAPLGRMATRVASVLRGKHKPMYTPHMDTGDHVIVINARHVHLTGKKEGDKTYHQPTGYLGNLKSATVAQVRAKHPERIVEDAVRGMLPKTKLGRALFRKLKVYADGAHPHQAQQPKPLALN